MVQAGPRLDFTLMIMARRRASMPPRTWAEAGTQEPEGDCHEEEDPLEEEVRNLLTKGA